MQFDAATGELAQFTVNGKPLFKTPMAVNALRAASSNEPGVMAKSMANGLRELKHELLSYEAIDNGNSVTVKQSIKVSGKQAENISGYGDTKTTITARKQPLNDTNTHFINNLEWTIYADELSSANPYCFRAAIPWNCCAWDTNSSCRRIWTT